MLGSRAPLRPSRTSSRAAAPGAGYETSEDLWVSPLRCIPDLLREFNIAPGTVFRRAGIDPREMRDPENRLPFERVGRLVAECVATTGCQHFGLLVGQRAGPGAVGIIQELMQSSPTLRTGLRALVAHLHLYDRGAVLTMHPRSNSEVELAYVVHHRDTPGTAQITDGGLAILLLLLRSVCGRTWTPIRTTFAHSRPSDVAPFRRFFKAPLLFDAPRSALIVRMSLLDQSIPGADARREAHIRASVADVEASNALSMTLRVRRALSTMLVVSAPSFDQVADAFGLSRRTLRRRLADEGASCSGLLDGLRCELARQLLLETRMSIQDIAETLHYSMTGAFSRSYKGWTGVTPSDARRAVRKAKGASPSKRS